MLSLLYGTKIPGGASNEDFTVTVNGLAHANPATISTLLNASVDTITVSKILDLVIYQHQM